MTKKTDTLQHSRHHSDHGNPKKHNNPHDHDWYDDDNNNHKPGPPTAVNTSFVAPQASEAGDSGVGKTAVYVAGGLAGVYILYQGIKWTIASLLAPFTAGTSYAVAFATP